MNVLQNAEYLQPAGGSRVSIEVPRMNFRAPDRPVCLGCDLTGARHRVAVCSGVGHHPGGVSSPVGAGYAAVITPAPVIISLLKYAFDRDGIAYTAP